MIKNEMEEQIIIDHRGSREQTSQAKSLKSSRTTYSRKYKQYEKEKCKTL